jgi:hypothetical protein
MGIGNGTMEFWNDRTMGMKKKMKNGMMKKNGIIK